MSGQLSAVSFQRKREQPATESSITQRSSLITQHWLNALWLALLAAYILVGTPLVPFHGDESTQIFMSRDYAYQVMQHDLSLVTYRDTPISATEQQLRLLNGTINKYLIGLAWHLSGFQLTDLNEQWDWGGDWNYNVSAGHMPNKGLLVASRWPSALLLAAGVVAMFALGRSVGGRSTAYFASLYYALNPPLLLNGRRAMMEGSATFFSLVVVLAGVWFLQKRSWRTAVLLGISGGLALASKHTTVFTVAAVLAVCAIAQFVGVARTLPPYKAVALLLLAVALSSTVFYSLNPAWWSDPVTRAGDVLRLRQELLDTQVNAFGGYGDLAEKVAGFAQQVFLALPQYYEAPEWSSHIGVPISAYEASPWRGVSIGGSLPGMVALLGMIGAGVWVLARTISASTRGLVGVWALVVTLSTLVLTPLEWQRYYLPVYPVVGLLGALGLSHLLQRFRR